jgi:hypothetical protein
MASIRNVRKRNWPYSRSICLAVLAGLLLASICANSRSWAQTNQSTTTTSNQLEVLASKFAAEMNTLAAECQTKGLEQLAKATQEWVKPRDPSRRYLFLPPVKYQDPGDPELTASEAATWPEWKTRVREQRQRYAAGLYAFAQSAAKNEQWNVAGMALWEALWQDPEHAALRRTLDYQGIEAETQPLQVKIARRPEPTLGWKSGAYREGNSTQFRLLTTADETTAREHLRQFEIWRMLWRQTCLPYWMNNDGVAAAIQAGRPIPGGVESKHTVVLFANRPEFLQALGHVAGIEQSVGYYDLEAERCYFYLDPNDPNVLATQKHELVHQLFQSTGKRVRKPGEKTNFWLLEAAAMYFESLTLLAPPSSNEHANEGDHRGEIWSVGGFDAQRLQFARLRWQRENYATGFSQLVVRGRQDFQRDPDLARLYSQIAGMFHYLMHAPATGTTPDRSATHATTHADATFRMLTKIYAGRDRADLFESETGATLEQLESEYRQWLAFSSQSNAPHLHLSGNKRELALGFSELDDQLLSQLFAPALTTLQLTRTPVTDQGLTQLAAQHHELRDLYLDQTATSDVGVLALIRANPALESLDLANTRITNETVMACRELANLEALWLTQTNVTDDCAAILLSLPKLRILDVQGTKISPELQQRLQAKFR